MSLPPRLEGAAADVPALPPVEPADYSDEITAEQIEALRSIAPQDVSAMGALVHEFSW